MGFQLLQEPYTEPVSVEEVAAFANISDVDDNSDEYFIIQDSIIAARQWAENYTRRAFVTQKWRMYLDAFPGYIDQRLGGNIVTTPVAIGATSYMAGIRWAIVPPKPPVKSIDALSFVGPDGSTVVMTENVDYLADIVSNPARVTPPYGKFWPVSRIQTNAVWIDWTAGYPDSGSPLTPQVPRSICRSIMMIAAHWHNNREAASVEGYKDIPYGVEQLLMPYTDLRL